MAEASIPSNFDVNDWITILAGADATCLDWGASTAAGDEGKLRFLCDPSHLSYNDPIVYPNQTGLAHLHQFFGNTLTDAYSTYQSLRTTGSGTCQGGPINRTGYWLPAMIKPASVGFPVAKVVKPAFIEIYYADNRRDTTNFDTPSSNPAFADPTLAIESFPNGFKFITGWKDTDGDTPFGVWGREDETGGSGNPTALQGRFQGTLADLAAHYPSSSTTDHIFARINFPPCWDGVNLDSTNHRSHAAYRVQDGFGNAVCPSTHPHTIPTITLIASYSHNGPADFSTWYLSSDEEHGKPGGHTFHTDWFGAWDNDIQSMWMASHLGEGSGGGAGAVETSSAGILCVGNEQLKRSFLDLATRPTGLNLPEANRYLDIPVRPTARRRVRLTVTA